MKKIRIHNNSLRFKPDYILNDYGFEIFYPAKKLKIHFQAQLKFHKYCNQNERIFSIDRKQLFVNNQFPDIQLYEMADNMAKSIFPVIFRTDNYNQITAIENYNSIRSRCESVVKDLSDYYKGEIAEKIINSFNKQYSNAFFLANQLQKDLFYELLFFPLHKQFSVDLKTETNYTFHFRQKAIPFLLLLQIEPEYTSSGQLIVTIKSIDNIENSQTFQRNTFEASYKLYPDDHLIASIKGKAVIANGENTQEIIEFELYHLNAEERNAGNKEDTLNFIERKNKVFIGEVEEVPKKKRFWSFLD